ncbi:thiolase family protein [Halobellus sp. Atlit-38R]|uniref:thiolase family protein n=1 Tax=Halobellus sp. Atlit-38R TaxID=2282131 RepID=UPI000EF24D78|nr:thiolase family protein [Halobellus sp. Atlit-38R]RLM89384.1 thiolase family protein [Halobellus sp. Atlit-38R]
MEDTTPVVVEAVRTPQGRRDGAFAETRSEDLSLPLVETILQRTGLGEAHVDDLLWGVAQQRDVQGNNLARVITLLAGLESVPGATINRWCASSAAAVARAADAIANGQRRCLLVGGVENMSQVGIEGNVDNVHPGLADRYDLDALTMGTTAEKVAERFDVSRDAQDRYALRSHERAAEATETGRFEDEIVPVETDDGVVTTDECIRPDTSLDALSELPTVFKDDGTVTPGNASQISDGAAAMLLTSRGFAAEHGLDVLAEVGDHSVAGVDPTIMGVGPIYAVRKLTERTGRSVSAYDLVELNEAFASQTIHCRRELGIDEEIFNVNGGAIALGHPLGATGARLPVTLIHEMRRRGASRGLATECVGHGQGMAIEFTVD